MKTNKEILFYWEEMSVLRPLIRVYGSYEKAKEIFNEKYHVITIEDMRYHRKFAAVCSRITQ